MDNVDIAVLAGAAVILLAQSTWLYADARHRSRHPWFWAVWGLIQCPMPLIFYLLFVRKIRRRRRRGQ